MICESWKLHWSLDMGININAYNSVLEEIYRIRLEISAAYDHDPHKLFLAVVEQQKQRAREG